MKENAIKAALTAATAAMIAYIGQLVVPIIVLGCVMLLDYGTGLAKAWVAGNLCSRTGIVGILKKVGYLCIVLVGMAVDWVLRAGLNAVGIDFKLEFLFAMIVVVWLIINELISILENVAAIGGPSAGFLSKLLKKLKTSVEEKAGDKESEEN
mgnify:CR=1 FL=1